MTKFDPTKPVQTRDGRKVRILCTDARLSYCHNEGITMSPIVALIEDESEHGAKDSVYFYTKEGSFYGTNNPEPIDLVNIPERVVKYKLIHDSGYVGATYSSIIQAKDSQSNYAEIKSILKLTYEDGKVVETYLISP